MTGVNRPVTQGQHTVSPAGNGAGCRKQMSADGRTPGPHFTRCGDRKTSKVWAQNRPHRVYKHIDSTGSVLYVGCTADPKGRQRTHELTSSWWPAVAKVVYEPPADRQAGWDRKRELIRELQPPHNYVHTARYVHAMGPEYTTSARLTRRAS